MQKGLLKSETNRVEFKRQLTDDIEKEIVAFLNYREGGLLYLGVDDESNILGVKNSDQVMLQIKDRLKHNIMPSCMGLFDIISEGYEGKDIIKIIIASGPEKPYYLKKYGMSERGAYMVNLAENNEYGYCSLVKAANQVLDKLDLENKTLTEITSRERKDTRLWNSLALREAIINALVHNDYSHEVPPKFELFDDRIEITSAGGLPEGLSQDEFFQGCSVPRNKEIMRIFKDLGLVEHLGSGIPRILESYGKECFKFSDNFLRITFPVSVTPPVTPPVELLELVKIVSGEMSRKEIQNELRLADKMHFLSRYLQPAIQLGLLEMTIPEKPNSRLQKYRLTSKGVTLKQNDL